MFFRSTDLAEVNVASYTTDTLGGAINFGYPIKETARLGFSFGVSNTEITAGRFAVQEITASPRLLAGVDSFYESTRLPDGTYAGPELILPIADLPDSALTIPTEPGFLDENGNEFLNWTVTTSWSSSTLNRGQLATRGAAQSVALELSVPGSDLEFYKLTYRGEIFFPIRNEWVLHFRGELGYGDGYGNTTELPFYEHFFAGGFGSVRGYEVNTLGPRSTPPSIYTVDQPATAIDENGRPTEVGGPDGRQFGYLLDPETGRLQFETFQQRRRAQAFGGNALVEGSAELLFPLPFVKDRSRLRSALFFDIGNVFNTQCGAAQRNCFDIDAAELRYSVGLGVTWLSGFGPLTFSLAKPLNAGEDDREEVFQFTLARHSDRIAFFTLTICIQYRSNPVNRLIFKVLAAAAIALPTVAFAQGKIAVVNLQEAILQSDQAQQRLTEVRSQEDYRADKEEFDRLQEELEDLVKDFQKDAAVMSQEQQLAARKRLAS